MAIIFKGNLMGKRLKSLLVIFLLTSVSLYSQIDTSNIYPLEIGNFWEFKGGGRHYYEKVIGSESMPNSKNYKVLQRVNLYDNDTTTLFRRVEDDKRVYYYNELNGLETKVYDVSLPEKSTWNFTENTYSYIENITNEYYNLIGDTAKIYYMSLIKIDSASVPPDTNWLHLYDDFAIGIGPILIGDVTGYWTLRGAIINGVTYGSITVDIDRGEKIPIDYLLKQNYPNPFNPTTSITYQLPRNAHVKLVVYNSLGQVVNTLVDQNKSHGKYIVDFNASNLPSGLYIYGLQVHTPDGKENFTQAKKMLLLK